MIQIPNWNKILIAVICALGLIYAAPNFFEEDAFEEIHAATQKKKPPPPATPARLHDEINRLEELSNLAASIRRPGCR